MAIADVSSEEKSWVAAHEVIQRVIDEVNLGGGEAAVMANQADSVAASNAALVTDFNLLLGKLKAAGYMAADV